MYPARAVSTWARLGSRSGPTAGNSTESSTVRSSAVFKTKETNSHVFIVLLKGLSHEIDFKNVDENGQILALIRAAAGF